jgi:hypothetical protein
MIPTDISFKKPFLHSGQYWGSPGHTKVVADLTRHVYPCGCTTAGDGSASSPIMVTYCAVHANAHALRNVLGNLLNCLPNSINDTEAGRKAREEAQRIFGNLTSSPASPITNGPNK